MATEVTIQEQFDRFIAHSGKWYGPEEYESVLADWCASGLHGIPDAAVIAAADDMVYSIESNKMPVLGTFVSSSQEHARAALNRFVTEEEYDAGNADFVHGLIEHVSEWLKRRNALPDHNHHPNADCRRCDYIKGVGERLEMPPAPSFAEPARFTCPCGEGRGWVFLVDRSGREVVRPCSSCRPDAYEAWSKALPTKRGQHARVGGS